MMTRRYRIGGLLLWGAALAAAAAQPDVVLGPKAGKTPDDVPALLRALRAEDMGTRWNAALLLGEIGDVSAVPALLECVTGDTNTRVRRRAIEALGKLGDPAAVPGLAEALKDSDRFVRRDAAMALGVLGDQTAVPALIDALDDQEGFVRREAAYALGLLNDDRAIPALQAAAR